MHIQDIFRQHKTTFSFEFFPPKTDEAFEELFATIARLQELQPSFVSVTYGAGGSTRERTHAPRGLGVGVAGSREAHPMTPNRLKEMDYLKQKVDAGADYVCTQLFFDNRDFYDFRERCELAGIKVPVVAGIMPITSKANMVRMAELALGARFPAGLLRGIARCRDDEAVARFGVHWATEQCRD